MLEVGEYAVSAGELVKSVCNIFFGSNSDSKFPFGQPRIKDVVLWNGYTVLGGDHTAPCGMGMESELGGVRMILGNPSKVFDGKARG